MMQNGMIEGMSGMGSMMWGMGLFGLLTLVLVILLVAALIKYLFFNRSGEKNR